MEGLSLGHELPYEEGIRIMRNYVQEEYRDDMELRDSYMGQLDEACRNI